MTESREAGARTWLRIVAGCALLTGLAFVQDPGFLVADTKFDLVEDPAGFLSRALHLWDDQGTFGQLQNQAYGYLWPMGPFFLLGDLVGLPGWVVQRLWIALVMCVAFTGAARLARAMGVRSDLARLVAAFAYATSPRMLSTLGPTSIEAWPSALAPWVLLPLVIGASRGSPRRMAMLSGLAIAMVGGVNAAATFAVIPLGAIWLLTRSPGPRRRALMLWWPLFTAVGTFWWLLPLFVMGAYSPPFLDFIESASVTTFPTTLFDALRGTTAWVPYVDDSWRGGNEVITQGYLALNSGLVIMLGLVGILLRSTPHRQFLLIGAGVGLLMVTLGHTGAVQGWFAEPVASALDGVLAPLRNVHKFDPVVRLPLVLGLAWLLEAAVGGTGEARPGSGQPAGTLESRTHYPVVGLAVLGVAGASLPLVTGGIAPAGGTLAVPDYWEEAADWVDERAGDSVSLLAPGSGFADYRWGAPRDEPFQYLLDSRWAVRNAVPLTPPGTIRMLDAVEERLAQGQPSEGLGRHLRRAGVRYVVVRNDLEPAGDAPDPVLVHSAIQSSPGLSRVATFGPDVGGEPDLEAAEGRVVVSGGWQQERPAVEIYQVSGGPQQAMSAESFPTVVGGPEDLVDLIDLEVVGDAPTVLAADYSDSSPPDGPLVLTDGMLDRERTFGRVHDAVSAVTTPGDVPRSGNPTQDYALGGGERWQTTAELSGLASLSVSSSRSDVDSIGGPRPGEMPYAAVDGDAGTTWTSRPERAGSAWWQANLERTRVLRVVSVTAGRTLEDTQRIRVVTQAGASDVVSIEAGETRTISIPRGPTEWLRVERPDPVGHLSLAEVAWAEREVRRDLVLPQVPEGWGPPDAVVLRALGDARTGCAEVDGRTPCREGQVRIPEEPRGFDRVVHTPRDHSYAARLTARPRPGAELDNLLQQSQFIAVSVSSSGVRDPRGGALATIDGDGGTSWTSSSGDEAPTVGLRWLSPRRITNVAMPVADSAPVRRPTEILLTWPDGERQVMLGDDGAARLEKPIRTDQLSIRVLTAEETRSIDTRGYSEELPIGVTELRLGGLTLDPLQPSEEPRRWQCGTGPTITMGDRDVETALVASPDDLYRMREVPVELCGNPSRLSLKAGSNAIGVRASDVASPSSMVLTSPSRTPEPAPVEVNRPDPATRFLDPAAGAGVVALPQNVNPGWVATQDGVDLEPMTVDGWRQGWRLEGSASPVRAEFAPDELYRGGLAVGAVLLLGLLGLALVPARRWGGRDLPALHGERLGGASLAIGAILVSGVLAGSLGALVGGVGVLLGRLLGRRGTDAGVWLVASLPMAAAIGYFLRPWGSDAGWAGSWAWPHYLVVLVLGAASAMVACGRPRFFRRMKGISTSRWRSSAARSEPTSVRARIGSRLPVKRS